MTKNNENRIPTLLIIGDSFVEGVAAEQKFGWAQRFSTEVKEYLCTDVSGIGGDTIKKILTRQRAFLKKRYDLVILEVGLNDSRFRPSLGRNEVAIDDFEHGIVAFIKAWRSNGAKVSIVGLTRVNEDKTVPYKEDKIYRNSDVDVYDKRLKAVCERTRSVYLAVPPLSDNTQYLADGIHPSTKGHKKLFNALKNQITMLLNKKIKW